VAAAPSCIAWDLLARRLGKLNTLTIVSTLQIIGILLPILTHSLFAAFVSALLFGGTVMGIVSLVLTMAGQYYPTRPAKMMGKMTLSYGAAQMIAPAITGLLASHFGGYIAGLYLAGAAMIACTLLFLMLRLVEKREGLLDSPLAV
jgi:MFS family permease